MSEQQHLTPQDLRENALENLQSARDSLATSPRNAAYLAGYAVEFVLKARYCRLRGWPHFPSSPSELKSWNARDGVDMEGKLFVHDLDALLKLSNSAFLVKSAFAHIDWDLMGKWSEHLRYSPKNSVTPADVTATIDEASKIVEELNRYELVDCLRDIDIKLTKEYGIFNLFAYAKHYNLGWCLFAS